MKITAKYKRILETYLEWESVITPASGSFQETKKSKPLISVAEDGLSAGEALCVWESTGKPCSVCPSEVKLLDRLLRGKAQRDWWTKEVGTWAHQAVFMPEEFLHFLGPLPFIELFGRAPIARIVRHYYDNSYSLLEFRLDNFMQSKVGRWGMSYYDRDDRDSCLKNAWRVIRVKWISPTVYRIKKRMLSAGQSK